MSARTLHRKYIVPILQLGAPSLRKKAAAVAITEIHASRTKRLIQELADTLRETEHGIAIAAPQVGAGVQIFLVLESVYQAHTDEAETPADPKEARAKKRQEHYMAFINPRIVRHAKKTALLEEGCLSVEGQYGKVRRYEKVTVRAIDENGKLFTRGASGLFAQVIQHETDHLSGVLFVDRATELYPQRPAHRGAKTHAHA